MSLFQLHQKFFWQEALMCVSHEARRAGQTRQAVLATHSAGSNTQVLSTGLLYKLSEKTTPKKVARKMTGLVCPKLSGAFETARVAVVIEVRTDCFWRTSRRKNKKIQNSQAWKGNQQIQRHKQLDFVDSFTSVFAGKFSPRFTRGGEKKKKKEIKCLRRSNYLLQFVPRGCQSGITADILWRSAL